MERVSSYKTILVWWVGAGSILLASRGTVWADYAWTRKADMPTARYGHSTSVVNGKIYAFGGDASLARVDGYDPATDTWTRKADMPTARSETRTCVLNNRIYVMGGGGSATTKAIGIVEVYDPGTDTWAVQTEVPTPRGSAVFGVVDGTIYVIGGKDGPGSQWASRANMVEAYDPVADTWARKADMPSPRWMHAGCVANGKIYVVGGWNHSSFLSAVEEYDPMTDTWTVNPPIPTARCLLDTSVVNGRICAIGGFRGGNVPLSTVEVYDSQTDTWTKGTDIPVPTEAPSTSVVDGVIYVMGGYASGADASAAVYASEVMVDFNGDGVVDAADVCIMADHWGENCSLCDIGPSPFGDGVVDVEDLKVLARHIGQEVDDPTLIAHWALDETEGVVAHDRAGGNEGTIMGGPQWRPQGGRIVGALELNGTSFVTATCPLSPADGPFSVLVWIKGGAPGQVMISQEDGSNWLMLNPATGALMTELQSGGRSTRVLYSDAIISDDAWHRVSFTWDGTNRRLYVDEVLVAEDTQQNLAASSGNLIIGAGTSLTPGTFWTGLIDDVRIYNRAVRP